MAPAPIASIPVRLSEFLCFAQVTVATPRGARIPPAAQEGDWSYCGPKLPRRNIRRFKLQGDQQTSGLSLRI